MEAAMPCKLRTKKRSNKSRRTDVETKGSNKIQKTKHACIVEADESTRKRFESTLPKDHEDHIARKGPIRWVTTTWCASLFLCLKRWKFRMWKQWTKDGSCQRGRWPKKGAKRRHSWSTQRQKESPLRYMYGHLSSLKCGVRTEVPKVQGPGRAPKWHCEGQFRILSCTHRASFFCVPNDCSKSNGCHCKTTRLCRTSSWRSVCLHPSENGGCSQMSECADLWIRLPRHQWPKSWFVRTPTFWPLVWKTV